MYYRRLHGEQVRLFYNIVPEAAVYLGSRDVAASAKSTVFNTQPDLLRVSGVEPAPGTLEQVEAAAPGMPVLAPRVRRLTARRAMCYSLTVVETQSHGPSRTMDT